MEENLEKNKEEAQGAYDEALARHDEAYAALLEARAELDECLRWEEAKRAAVFNDRDPDNEEAVATIKAMAGRRREQKRVLHAQSDGSGSEPGQIGEVS